MYRYQPLSVFTICPGSLVYHYSHQAKEDDNRRAFVSMFETLLAVLPVHNDNLLSSAKLLKEAVGEDAALRVLAVP
jgi:hypothetical protein